MTKHAGSGPAADTSFDGIWRVPDAQVASGRIPGYVGAVRVRGQVEVRAGGTMAVGPTSAPMDEHTLFRIASVTKPMGGALALALVQEGVLALDDPIARWLPEAANPRVLVAPDAPLHRTTDAQRPITVRHLLTMTSGWGAVFEETPLQGAMIERGVYPGALPPPMTGDEFVARVADLPLAFQPGEGWLYDTGTDVLGVLLARAAGKPLSDLLAERITGPLDMTSTSSGRRRSTGSPRPIGRRPTGSRCWTLRAALSPPRPGSRS
jgi:CubicO group peptidase (beta-lactamase class C family)